MRVLSSSAVLMVASCCERRRVSSPARRFSPILPGILVALSMMLSMFWYSASHLAAVFGPTFGTPGMLSEVSPTSARKSITWSARSASTLKRSAMLAVVVTAFFMVSSRVMSAWVSSCAMSLSPLEMTTW